MGGGKVRGEEDLGGRHGHIVDQTTEGFHIPELASKTCSNDIVRACHALYAVCQCQGRREFRNVKKVRHIHKNYF